MGGSEDNKKEVLNNSKHLVLDNNAEEQFLAINNEFEGAHRISVAERPVLAPNEEKPEQINIKANDFL